MFTRMMTIFAFVALIQAQSQPHRTQARFDLSTPQGAPFPSNWFTVADQGNNTRLRVNLPFPNCAARPSDCADLAVINTLDGFNADPRLSIPFDGPIDVATVTSDAVFLIRLSQASCGDDQGDDEECEGDIGNDGGQIVGIDQIVWDPQTNVLHVGSREFLDQHTRYALIVTSGIRDMEGRPVEPDDAFRRFRQSVRASYRRSLLEAIRAAQRVGVREDEVVSASVFTTQTVTTVLEKIRDQVKAATPQPADFRLGPGKTLTVFPVSTVTGIMWNQQTGADPPTFTNTTVGLPLLQTVPGAVGTIAFGKYISPDYEVHPGEFIPPIATDTGIPERQGMNEIYFNLFLPSGSKPADGWPVAIFGHENTGNKNNSFNVAATMAAHGIATIAINAVGHGFGPLGTLTVSQIDGKSVTFSAGGRGIDQNGDHGIDANEGVSTAPPRAVLFFTDGIRQTVADLMEMVQVIKVGVDVDGDGLPDLNPSRIYYFSNSLGSNYGTVFLAVEPEVHTGVLTSLGGPPFENRRSSPSTRPQFGQLLASRVPSLINLPGVTVFAGVPVGQPGFDENYPLRDSIPFTVRLADGTSREIQSPVINTVGGAIAIQEVVENMKWAGRSGDSVAYAPYIRKTPLAGLSAKSVILQYSKGDQSAPNPNATALVRAGDLADRTTFYRHDLAYAENPMLPKNPHNFMVSIGVASFRAIALAAQEQIATFFATDGAMIIQPLPVRFFEVPIKGPLPEDFSFIP